MNLEEPVEGKITFLESLKGYTNIPSSRVLARYVAKEYLSNFFVAFFFFFFIFFINQILVMVQEILLKNVNISTVIALVILTIPQFLLYTFPFSSLTAASMVIGDLSSRNEILAIRASGISIRKVFAPIVFLSLLISGVTFWCADVLNPWSAEQYARTYAKIIRNLPTMALEPYTVTEVSGKTIATGNVKNNVVYNIAIFDLGDEKSSKTISAQEGRIRTVDANNFLYSLDLTNPTLVFTDSSTPEDYSFARASGLSYLLNFSSQVPSMANPTPSQMKNKDLRASILEKKNDDFIYYRYKKGERNKVIEDTLYPLMRLMYDPNTDIPVQTQKIKSGFDSAQRIKSEKYINFYYQYYRSEYHKKLALSAACFFLVFIAFPISFVKVKHGRLIGFGLSIGVAVGYWFALFFAQMNILDITFSPGFLIWAPNAFVFLIALILIVRLNRL